MSGSRVYEFHQREINDLKTAAIFSLAVCTNLKRLLEGIRDNQPRWAARGIIWLLDPNNKCQSYLDKVDHLIDPVGVPVKVPRRAKVHRGSDGIHYEKKFPLTCGLREAPMAHRAAWVMHDTFSKYLWDVWCRGNPTYLYTDDVGAATEELVTLRWQEIRDELQAFVDYDCDGLRQAVAAESEAAMDQCRRSIVGSGATVSTEPDAVFVPTPLQAAILDALEGKAMKKQSLADEVCGGEGTRLYRKDGIKELRDIGRVDHKHGVGYFRPDAPP